jgi:hypothetical protein
MIRPTLLLFLYFCLTQLSAQNLTGKWQGSFMANGDAMINNFTYEILIKENASHQITAQTITKKGDQFYASAFATGSHSLRTQLVQINETSFDQIKIANQLEACLMSNFLTYKNIDGHEILEGSYMASVMDGKRNCGSGKVFLERATNLISVKNNNAENKKIDIQKSKLAYKQNVPSKIKASSLLVRKSSPSVLVKNASNTTNQLITAAEKNNTTTVVKPMTEVATDEEIVENTTVATNTNTQNTIRNQPINLPWVLVGRENKLVKKIITNSKNITIDLFDNGTIDNDTIIVFDNKQLLVNKKRLSYKSIHLEFNFTENMREHEVIIVAHNMGTVPPNTALLLFKDGKNRQEYFITSTNKTNAKLLIIYEPPKLD